MVVRTKKRAICIGMMLVLTTFAYSAAHVMADDVYPVAEAGGPYVSFECSEITFDASGSYDPLGGTLEYRWNFMGNWTDWSYYPITQNTWYDDYQGSITLEVRARGLTASDATSVTVNNAPPTITNIDLPLDPVNVGQDVAVTIHFYDGDPRQNSLDTYVATFNWGDSTSSDYSHGAAAFPDEDMTITGDHVYTVPGVYSGSILLMDDNGGETNAYFTITVVGSTITFTVDAGPNGIINEGSLFTSTGSFYCSVEGSFTGSVNYSDGTGEQTLPLNPDHSFALSHSYVENGMYSIVVTIVRDGADSVTDSAVVTVNNVAPTATLTNNGPKDEGSPVTITFTNQYDPGVTDTFTYSFDWENDGTYDVVNQVGASATHIWFDNGVYTVKGRIMDNDGGFSEYTTVVTVNNVAPTAVLGNDGPKAEGTLVTISFSGQYDPGTSDTFTYSFDWNNDGMYEYVNQVNPSMTHTWYDNGVYTVKGKIQDDDGGFTEYVTAVTVGNVPPTIISLSGPPTDPVLVGTSISLTGVFTDPGTLDTHVALITWDDGSSTTVNLAAGVYQVSKSHTYTNVGVYIITLTVTDDDGGSDTKSIQSYVVVYSPSGGFITGGGWLISPAGSYPANPTLTGRVNFGFVCKYKKGQTIPDGETEFQFQLADINFHSQSYEWLVIMGAKGTYQGVGTINGEGHYGFKVTVIDGQQSGGGGVDKFRMKIWDKDHNDQIVYDTDYPAPDSQNPSVALSGGQITIHKA
jgi:PKD repeat protein